MEDKKIRNDSYVEVDKNMIVETSIKEPDIRFYDVRKDPFDIYGLYDPKNEKVFKRMPDEYGENISNGVKHLYTETAGGRVRFSTDSSYVAIKCVMPRITRYPHMQLTGTTGFDLFEDGEFGSRYVRVFRPDVKIDGGYESVVKFNGRKMRHFTIYFPTYNPVNDLYIGVQEDAAVGHGLKYRSPLPVVYYGNSITQGACSSRAGIAYESIISRNLNLDYINLGFSGSGCGEDKMTEYLASLDMLAFVSDYDHNAPNVEHLRNTHCRLYKGIRAKHPKVPYIMISRPDFIYSMDNRDVVERRNVIIDTYRYARSIGDKNVYYIDGEGFFRGPDEDICSVDGSHPTDMGFSKMADAIGKMLERSLRNVSFDN